MSGFTVSRSLRQAAAVGAFAACMALGGTAHAALFGIHGVFSNGGTLSGSFAFDQSCSGICGPSAYSNIDITTTTASILGATYDGPAALGSTQFSLLAGGGSNLLALGFFAGLKNLTSGSVDFTGFETGWEAGPKSDIDKRSVYGKISVVPVPAALPILLTGLVGLFGLRLRRRRETPAA